MDIYETGGADIALVAATPKTVLQITTPSTIRGRLSNLEISFDGTTAGATPVLIQLVTQTTAGTGTAVTPNPIDPSAPASLITSAKDFSAEPTVGVTSRQWRVSPNAGLWYYTWPQVGEMPSIPISARLAIKMNAAAGVNVTVYMRYWA